MVTVLPRMTAPAERSAAMQAASASGWRPLKNAEPCSVGMSAVSMMSLMPTGTPCSGPMPLPALRASSAALACASARSRIEKRPGLHLRLERGDAVEAGADQRLRRDLAAGDGGRSRGGGQGVEIGARLKGSLAQLP